MPDSPDELRAQIVRLERENERLRRGIFAPSTAEVVQVPAELRPLFEHAERAMGELFGHVEIDPARAMIGIGNERYLLVRASAFAIDFLDTLVEVYADRGQTEALAVARSFLFDIAHTIGLHDARTINDKLGSNGPLQNLSAGPVRFAYTGWSHVAIRPESRAVADDDYCLIYDHSYSFEADAFVRAGRSSATPVCIMSAGYSSGWCEASFGIPLTAVEIQCKARGDSSCTFVMAPPARVAERIREHFGGLREHRDYDIPTYFERKRAEEQIREALSRLEATQAELLRKERLATVGILVSGVAHEVNTPLGVAVTAAGVVGEELAGLRARFEAGSLRKGDLRAFFERAEQAEQMVRTNLERAAAEITKFKRVSVDHVSEEKRRLDVAEHVRQTLDHLRPLARQAGLVVSVTSHGDLRCVTYPGALAQILTNFVTNTAMHGTRDDGQPTHVHVHVAREGESIVLRYQDTGRGMTSAVQEKAFQPFFTTTRARGGSGLGLHIVQSLVAEVLRGTITLESSAAGTQLTVTFPMPASLTRD